MRRCCLAPKILALCLATLPGLAMPAGADTLIVANKAEATVSLIDVATGEVRATLPTGVGPHEVAVSPDGRRAVVADYGTGDAPGGTLTLIDVAAGNVLSTIDLGEYQRPHGMAWPEDDALFVTAEAQKVLLRVDPGTGTVVRAYPTGQEVSHMVAVAPDVSRAFVANIGSGTVTAIDLTSGEKLGDVATGEGAEGIAVTPDGARVWVTNRAADTVSVIDAATLKVVETLELGSFPIRAEVTPDGAQVLVSNARSGSVAVIGQSEVEVLRTIAIEVRVAAQSEEGAEGEVDRLLRFGDSPVPIGIEIAPDGERAYVALANADQIFILDLEKGVVSGQVTAGREPDGMGYSKVSVSR